MLNFRRQLAVVIAILFIGFNSQGVCANPVTTENVTASIISEYDSVAPGESLSVALRLDIREGWHTYWRNPGDSGQATSIKWTLPHGVTASEISWPHPERQFVGPVANYGYHGTALHLVKLHIDASLQTDAEFNVVADANWLVCEEECIPEKAQLRFTVKTSTAPLLEEKHQAEFARARAALPKSLNVKSGYQYLDSTRGIRFEFSPHASLLAARSIEYFPYDWGVVQAPAKQTVVQDSAFISIETAKGDLDFSKPIAGVVVLQTADSETQAYEVESSPGPLIINTDDALQSKPKLELPTALLFAFLGGIILNLMPCVFPVLFMKALSLVAHAGGSASQSRLHGLVYTGGVLASFTILATVLISVKAAGLQVGWGFQLQSPLFVSVIAVVMFVLGLSLSGYVKLGTNFMGAGNQLASKRGFAGSFFTGVLAVIVATPCTAPFMGPAIGFAFTQSSIVAVMVLLALGLGLALPYLVLSFFPMLVRLLPKPGLWMERFQQFLAFPMYASAAWLVWVVSQQAGSSAVFVLLLVLILVSFSIWLWQCTRASGLLWLRIGNAGVVITVALAATLMLRSMHNGNATAKQNNATDQNEKSASFQIFTDGDLTQLRADGRAVFVNMTAAWCITCLANERVALSSPQIKKYFTDNDITYLKGDWTNQDEHITNYLDKFGRNSVPLYVYYPKGSGVPKVLPQILTVTTLIDSIDSANSSNLSSLPANGKPLSNSTF